MRQGRGGGEIGHEGGRQANRAVPLALEFAHVSGGNGIERARRQVVDQFAQPRVAHLLVDHRRQGGQVGGAGGRAGRRQAHFLVPTEQRFDPLRCRISLTLARNSA